jgi:type II secretory pathway component PulJ
MSSIALELDSVLAALGSERARVLESAVRRQIAQAKSEAAEWQRVMATMQKNHPQAATCVGAFADTDLQRPSQGETPPAKAW